MTSRSVVITGPFTRVKCAPIPDKFAAELRKATLELYDLDEFMESSEEFFSIYGADFDTVSVSLDGVFEYSAKSSEWYKVGLNLSARPSGLYMDGSSLDLNVLRSDTSWALLIENYSGDERRDFKGKFDFRKMEVVRANLRSRNDVLADVIQVNYAGAEIIDDTEGEFDSVHVFSKGKLEKMNY